MLFARTTDLVQRLQIARRELGLEAAINRLERSELLILNNLAYVTKDQAETSVLFDSLATLRDNQNSRQLAWKPECHDHPCSATPDSHLDWRALLFQIVAPPTLIASELELELLGERRGLLEFLQPRGHFTIASIELLRLLGNRALMFGNLSITVTKGFVSRLQITEQR